MIELKQLNPTPLVEQGLINNSGIWNKEIRFEKGKNYLILAPSGKGKSTLLHSIYGLRSDYEGSILFEEKDIKKVESEELAEIRQSKLSIVFQNLRLFDQLTAEENILLKANLQSYKSAEEIRAMATQLGVVDLLKNPCGTLSFGQRQRIAIIRALSQPFDYLLLDEPFSHLDEANIKAATLLIQTECTRQNSGLILVSLGEEYLFKYDQKILV